jgi:S1-C subfamily serine protease
MLSSILSLLIVLQDEDKSHRQVYENVVESVVAVRSLATLGERSGTGIILDSDGLILTSYSVCPEGAENIRVYLKGPKLYKAEIVATSKKDELTILKIKVDRKLKPLRLGTSSKVKVGQVSYTIGNAYNSFINDDSPAFNVGIISGFYNLKEAKQNSFYTSYVLETTAAVNWGMEGAPLLDAEGYAVGMITLNYSPARWLGNAIPMDVLKPRVQQLVEQVKKPEPPPPVETPDSDGYLGFTVKLDEKSTAVVVDQVDPKGPAASQGIQSGDVIESIGGKAIKTVDDFTAMTKTLKSGSVVWIKLNILGTSQEVKIEAATKPKPKK